MKVKVIFLFDLVFKVRGKIPCFQPKNGWEFVAKSLHRLKRHQFKKLRVCFQNEFLWHN